MGISQLGGIPGISTRRSSWRHSKRARDPGQCPPKTNPRRIDAVSSAPSAGSWRWPGGAPSAVEEGLAPGGGGGYLVEGEDVQTVDAQGGELAAESL